MIESRSRTTEGYRRTHSHTRAPGLRTWGLTRGLRGQGLVPSVRGRRKDGMGLVVALSRSIAVPGAGDVVSRLRSPRSSRSLRRAVPGVRRILRVLTIRRGRREVRVCHFGNHAQMTTAAVRRVHSSVVTVRTGFRRRIRCLEPGLGGLSDCVGECLQIVAAWFQRVRIRRDAHNLQPRGAVKRSLCI